MTFPEIIQLNKLVLVDFTAAWCGPCKMLAPVLHEVKEALGDTASIIKIDVDQNPAIASEYQVQGVPTLILFKEGKQVWRQSGVLPKQAIVSAVQKFI
ncbi:MAG: thioredoxin [Chitinophagaceae bacterium]|nr:thioredoxin [Chitinophagaceae bacterium]